MKKTSIRIPKMILLALTAMMCSPVIHAQGIHGKPAIQKPAIKERVLQPKTQAPVSVKKNATGSLAADQRKPALNMKEFKTRPAYAARQAKYAAAFTNPSKSFKMSDGSTLKIALQKSSDGGQTDHISVNQSNAATEKGQSDWKCASSSLEVTAQTTNFGVSDYQKQAAHIYPGAIYTFESLMSGAFNPPSGTRNPIIVSTDNKNINGDTYVEVPNPSQNTIQNGIAELYRRFPNSGSNGSTTMQLYESYNTADWTLKLNAGGSAWGVSINNSFNASDKSQHRYLTIDVKKTLFTINTAPPENGFFSSATTESTPNLMFISSVSYGIRILANLEVTFKSASAANEFNAKYKAGIYGAEADLKYFQNNSSIETKINAYIVGGPNEGVITMDRDKLMESLNKILAGATYKNAQAISYSLCNMAGDVIGAQSATDRFTYRNCVPQDNAPVLKSAIVNVRCGKDGKDKDTHYQYILYSAKTFEGTGLGKFPTATYVNNTNNTRFEDNSNYNSNEMTIRKGQYTLNDFLGKGSFEIYITPNGHDNWDINMLTLTLGFSDGTSKQLQWNMLTISHENRSLKLYFQGGPNGTIAAIQ